VRDALAETLPSRLHERQPSLLINGPEKGVIMEAVVESVVEVQELSLAELAQVSGGLGDAVLA
jgi:hypothetical protein